MEVFRYSARETRESETNTTKLALIRTTAGKLARN